MLDILINSLERHTRGDIASSVPDYQNKANIEIKQVTRIFLFPSAYKSYVYTTL